MSSQLSCETWLTGSFPVENVQSSNCSFQHWPGELTWLSRWLVHCNNRFQTDETVFFFTSLGISVQHHIVTFLLVRCVYPSPECVENKTRQYIVCTQSWYNLFVLNQVPSECLVSVGTYQIHLTFVIPVSVQNFPSHSVMLGYTTIRRFAIFILCTTLLFTISVPHASFLGWASC